MLSSVSRDSDPLPGSAARSPGRPIRPDSVERWTPPASPIDPWLVLRLCRYRRREDVPPTIREAAEQMAARAGELAAPQALFGVTRVLSATAGGVRLDPNVTFSGGGIGGHLADCPLAVPFALTIGSALEAEAASLADRQELLEAYLLDIAGWAAIEIAVRALRLDLAGRGRPHGWRITHRLAPGYTDWPLAEQARLLRLLERGGQLVSLSEHGVLLPFKSITGLFGLAPAGEAPATRGG